MKSICERARFAGQRDKETPCRAVPLARQLLGDLSPMGGLRQSVAGDGGASLLDGFGKSAAHRPKHKRRDFALRSQRKIGGSARKLRAMVQLHSCLAEKLGGEAHVFGAVDAPEPQLPLMTLEEVQGLFQLLHSAVKRRREKENPQIPGVAGVKDLDADAVFAGLIAFHAATVVVADGGRASGRLLSV